MNSEDANGLMDHYFLGTISAHEMERLDGLLRSDLALREAFSAAARLDANLREAASQLDEDRGPHNRISLAKSTLWVGLAAAAALILAAYLFLWPQGRAPNHIAQIVEVGGSLRWTGDGGEVKHALTTGLLLSGGTLESLSADSWAKITFQDGSNVALSGQSSMTFSQSGAARIIRLREGSLSAKVAPIRTDQPMQFITPTAVAEVLGTQFTLRADSSSTRLIVYEGHVHVTRLADGMKQDVPAEHFVIATLDKAESFLALPREKYVDTWASDLPNGIGHGKWHPGQESSSGYLEAKPLLWKEYGKHMVLDLASLSAIDESERTALLYEGADVRMVGRLREGCIVHFGLTTHRVGGGFAGKYIASLELPGSKDLFEMDLPITAFKRQYPCFPETLIGHELIDWWALTIDQEAGLEIISVELLAP